jgi:hypothetical protein
MNLNRVRGGELVAAIGGLVLLISLLFLNWYGIGISLETPIGDFSAGGDFGAWDGQGALGTLANLVILAAGVAALGLALVTASARTVALPVAASAMTAGLGVAASALIIGRMLFQPGPNTLVDLEFGIYLALAGALIVAYGGWQGMQEEGTSFADAREQLGGRGPGSHG